MGTHDLVKERGRRAKPTPTPEERFCKFCEDKVENEIHFIAECPIYADARDTLLPNIYTTPEDFFLMFLKLRALNIYKT